MPGTETEPLFKTCGSCRARWSDWRGFVADPGLRLLGLQVAPALPDANALVFEHRCGSTVSVLASRLRHLLAPEDRESGLHTLFGSDVCSGHCRSLEDMESCDRPCRNARDRRLLLVVAGIRTESATEAHRGGITPAGKIANPDAAGPRSTSASRSEP